jgi:hypothetical protein
MLLMNSFLPQTYGNLCGLEAAQCDNPGLTKASDGECLKECGPKVCTADYRPVCGSDGQVRETIHCAP